MNQVKTLFKDLPVDVLFDIYGEIKLPFIKHVI